MCLVQQHLVVFHFNVAGAGVLSTCWSCSAQDVVGCVHIIIRMTTFESRHQHDLRPSSPRDKRSPQRFPLESTFTGRKVG